MINFDSLTLKLFLQENEEFFLGAKIQKVQQPNRNELIFQMRNNGKSKKFYINFNPNFYHLCFMSDENEKKRNIVIPKTAPMFCMLLRKYIQNTKIVRVEVPKYERIFEIYFEYYDELNEKSLLCLAIELMGKHSNVILYNYDTNVIIGCAHNVSSEKSRERELAGLLPYIYPPKQKKKSLQKITFDSFDKEVTSVYDYIEIAKKYHYLTAIMLQEYVFEKNIKTKSELYVALKELLSLKNVKPLIKKDFSQYVLFETKDVFNCANYNEMIDIYFSHYQQLALFNNLKNKILRHVQTQLKKLYSLKEKQLIQINKMDKALIYKLKADILMSNLYYLKQGMKNANLFDFEGNEITIDLDENLSPTDNANRYYALYKKSKTANEHAQELMKETVAQIMYYEEIKFYAESAHNYLELQELSSEIFEENGLKDEKIEKVDFIELDGFKIYIGKNKKQNDYLLSKIASSEDLWFHPLNAAGAHIIVKKNNSKEEVTDNVLLKAALITKEYSSQRENSKTCIIYTKRKYVKKANNKLAFVTYKNETEIVV